MGSGRPDYVEGLLQPLLAGLKDRVALLGQLPSEAVAAELGRAEMLVLPSYFDSSPNVIAEAQVAGVPVIGTDVGGIPSMIRHGQTGQLVPSRDVGALTRAIRHFLEHPHDADQCATRALSDARERFGRAQYVRRLLQIYRETALPAGNAGR